MRLIDLVGAGALMIAAPIWAAPSLQDIQGAALEHALAKYNTPAMASVVIREGEAQPEVVRGVRLSGHPETVRVGERWLLGSNTKAMTATLIGMLVDDGKLKWTARLQDMLPDLATEMRPEYRDATLADLLSHYAGLPEAQSRTLTDDVYVQSIFDDRRPMPEQRLDYIRKCLADAPIAPPRTRHSYSNTGYIIAAMVAERVGGKPYESLMDERVFKPLKMTSATFSPPAAGELTGHAKGRRARPEDANPSIFNGAGQVRMTMDDWARFAIDQLDGAKGKGKLLKPETYRLMQTAYGATGEPTQSNPHFGFGWFVQRTVNGREGPALTHSGSDGVWIADIVLFPGSRNGLLIATNAAYDMGAQNAMNDARQEIIAAIAPLAPAAADEAKP